MKHFCETRLLLECTGAEGRPRLFIAIDQLEFFVSCRFSVHDMAAIIGCSVRTVHRRLRDAGMSVGGAFSTISDSDLDEIVAEINLRYPRHGYRNINGHLQLRGINVPRRRVRDSLVRVDPS